MSIRVTTVTGAVLAANKISQFLCAHYNVNSYCPQKYFDGCMQTFLVCHALSYPNSGLIIARHNEIHDEIVHLAKQSLSPNCISGELLVHLVRSRYDEEVCLRGRVPETWGEMSIWGLWDSQTEAIIDARLVDADVDTWEPVIMCNLLTGWKKTKKEKHGQTCYNHHRHFSPFVLSVYGMVGKEAIVVLATLS